MRYFASSLVLAITISATTTAIGTPINKNQYFFITSETAMSAMVEAGGFGVSAFIVTPSCGTKNTISMKTTPNITVPAKIGYIIAFFTCEDNSSCHLRFSVSFDNTSGN